MRPFRLRSSTAVPPQERGRWVRAAAAGSAAIVTAFALVIGAVPGFESQTAVAGSTVLGEDGDFLMTVTVNRDESVLHPGGHVVYDLTAFNPAPRDRVWPGSGVVSPNYSLLLAYGMETPTGLTPQDSEGFFAPGNFGIGGSFYGGTPRDFGASTLQDLDFSGLGANIATTGIRGQESVSGQLEFGIPADAEVGSTYSAGVFIVIGGTGGGAYVRDADHLDTFTVLPVPTQTEVTGPTTPVQAGRPVDLRATVSSNLTTVPGTPEGTVTFSADNQTRTVAVVDGVAATSMAFETEGAKPVLATFAPKARSKWVASSGAGEVSVVAAETELELTVSPDAVPAQPTTFTARVTSGAEGTVTFTVDGEEYLVTVVGGIATTDHVFTTAGSYPVHAEFAPANPDRYSGSVDETTVLVEPKATPGSPSFGSIGETVTDWLATVDFSSLAGLATR